MLAQIVNKFKSNKEVFELDRVSSLKELRCESEIKDLATARTLEEGLLRTLLGLALLYRFGGSDVTEIPALKRRFKNDIEALTKIRRKQHRESLVRCEIKSYILLMTDGLALVESKSMRNLDFLLSEYNALPYRTQANCSERIEKLLVTV